MGTKFDKWSTEKILLMSRELLPSGLECGNGDFRQSKDRKF
jgi:hypothetical protein